MHICRSAPLAALLLLAAPFFAPEAYAQQVMITPGSLVLTDAERNGEIIVTNVESIPVTYRVEPVLFEMRDDGLLVEVATLDASAENMLRYAPRQFEVAPGASQVVRVTFRAPATLPAGEYRLHLRMRNLGTPFAETRVATLAGEIAVQMPLTVARAARILVRHAVGAGKVAVENLSIDKKGVHFSLANQFDGGSASGTIRLESNGTTVSEQRYSVYAELARRNFDLPVPHGVDPQSLCLVAVSDDPTVAPQRRCL